MQNPFKRKSPVDFIEIPYKKEKHPALQLLFAVITTIIVFVLYSFLQLLMYVPNQIISISLFLILNFLLFTGVYLWLNKRQRSIVSIIPSSSQQGIKIAISMAISIFLLQMLIGIIRMALLGETDELSANQTSIENMISDPNKLLFVLLMIVFVAPFLEELIFRRILIGKVLAVKTKMFYFRVMLSIFAFAGLHVITELAGGITVEEFFSIFTFLVISILITYVYVKTGSFWFSILTHFLNNSIAAMGLISML